MSDTEKKIFTHKDLTLWKEAMGLAKEVYVLTENFPSSELYGLRAQIRRSAISLPSNISEGAARQTTKEFIKFLYIASGSLSELETQILLAMNLGFISENSILSRIENVRKLLIGLIKKLQSK